jgi:hypothetical protein
MLDGNRVGIGVDVGQGLKSWSWVIPRSSAIGSYLERPGDLCSILGSPPSRCEMTSVVRLSALMREMPATTRPLHFTRNLKSL